MTYVLDEKALDLEIFGLQVQLPFFYMGEVTRLELSRLCKDSRAMVCKCNDYKGLPCTYIPLEALPSLLTRLKRLGDRHTPVS